MLLGSTEGLAERLRAAAEALEPAHELESGWLHGAAALVERGEQTRRSTRAGSVWLEELAAEARARKAALLRAWLEAAGALRAALHAHDSERGPLTQALFPEWREPALRRHVDQALAFEVELQRRLSSGYVVRRLAEPATEGVLRPALDALAAAQASWSAERDRPALSSPEADGVRSHLLALAEETARTLERVRAVVRAALAERPELIEPIFPRRARSLAASAENGASADGGAADARPSPASDAVEVERDVPRPGNVAAGEASRATPDAGPGEALENGSEGRRPRSGKPRENRAEAPRARKRAESSTEARGPRLRAPVESAPEAPRPRGRKPVENPRPGEPVVHAGAPRPARSRKSVGNPVGGPRPRSVEQVANAAEARPLRSSKPLGKRADAPHGRTNAPVAHAPETPAARRSKPTGTPPRSGSRRIAVPGGEHPAPAAAPDAGPSVAGSAGRKRARPVTSGPRPRRSSPPARRS
jgi:hypothetical protein